MTKKQAIESFRGGNPTTGAFRALGIPFEYFLRFAQVSETTKQRVCAGVVERYTNKLPA